jgi:hypothetical protein
MNYTSLFDLVAPHAFDPLEGLDTSLYDVFVYLIEINRFAGQRA